MNDFASTTFLRPIFLTLLISLLIVTCVVIYQRHKREFVGGLMILVLSIVSMMVSGFTLHAGGLIADEFNISGDALSFYLFIGICIVGVLNPVIYYRLWDLKT